MRSPTTRPTVSQEAQLWQQSFAKTLRAFREARELSVRELVSKAGLYWVTVMRYERAEQPPSLSDVYALARQLDVSLHDLLPERAS